MAPKKIPANPKLEALREEGLKSVPTEFNVTELVERTKKIHAGWVFDFKYQRLLQKLCRLLDGNYDTHNTAGWGSFGNRLGLTSEILNVIQHSKLGNEGYTYYVLQHYIQKDDSAIHNIVDALLSIKRLDVINETYTYFNNLADDVLVSQSNSQECGFANQQNNEEESGYYSGSSDFRENQENRSDEYDRQVHNNVGTNIIRPNFIPTPALVLRDLEKQVQLAAVTTSINRLPEIVQERIQTSDVSRTPRTQPITLPEQNNRQTHEEKKQIQTYDCKVLLTFAADGVSYANDTAKTLRKKRADGLNIGVLILDEHRKLVDDNPELFIAGSFPQVDYIIPIITNGYLDAAVNVRSPMFEEYPYIDNRYVRFIYSLMHKNYVRSGCLNKKVRCVIPDELVHLTRRTLMREPIFETWVKSSSVHKLGERMLTRCIRKKNNCTSET